MLMAQNSWCIGSSHSDNVTLFSTIIACDLEDETFAVFLSAGHLDVKCGFGLSSHRPFIEGYFFLIEARSF